MTDTERIEIPDAERIEILTRERDRARAVLRAVAREWWQEACLYHELGHHDGPIEMCARASCQVDVVYCDVIRLALGGDEWRPRIR